MSTEQWGGLVEDWTHVLDDRDDQDSDEQLDHDLVDGQQELEYDAWASSSMLLPSTGEEGDKCQIWLHQEFCDECGYTEPAPNRCERRECPNCGSIWSEQRSRGFTERFAAKRYSEDDGIDRRAIHAVFSPPDGEIRSLQDVYSGFREVYEMAEEKGIRGGVVVFHGFRVKDSVQAEYEEEDPEMGIWGWVKNVRVEDWRSLTYWSPHWHVIGLSRDFEADNPDKQDGWVARRIRSLESYDGLRDDESYEDMVKCCRYILSHATFEMDSEKDCVRWFGELATSKFSAESELSEGSLSVIERKVEEVLGAGDNRGEGPDTDDFECSECGSESSSPIWEAGTALQNQRWCEEIGKENQRRLQAAFEWRIGEREPPPGMKNPRSKEEAEEALEELL